MKEIEYITKEEQWHGVLSEAKRLHPSFSPEWESALSEAFPYVTFKHGVYKGKWGVRLALIGGRITATPFSDGGNLFALGEEKISLNEFSRDLSQEFSSYRVHVNAYIAPVLEDADTDLVDYMVRLQEAAEMYASFRSTLRHVLNRESDLHFSPVESEEEMREVYGIYLSTMKSVRNIVLPYKVFEYLKNSHDIYVARKGGKIFSFAVFMSTRKNVSYYLSGATNLGKEYDAPTHLLFYCMSHYYNLGMKKMYLGGTRKGTGLDTFKRGWRGKPVPVYTISSNEERENTRTSPLRNLWSFVPISLTPQLSKIVGKYVL